MWIYLFEKYKSLQIHQEKRWGVVACSMSQVSKGDVAQRAIRVVQGVREGQIILRVHQKAQIGTENSPDNSLYLKEKQLNNNLKG